MSAINAPSDSTVQDLDQRFKAARDVRRVFENEWTLQLAMGLGHQWVQVDSTGRVFDVDSSTDRVTLTDNRLRPTGRTEIARLSKTDPIWQGIPKDRSDNEVQRARVRTDVFEHYWRELELSRRYRLALWYRYHTGLGWLKTVWDQTAGIPARYVAIKGSGVLTDPFGRPLTPDRLMPLIERLTPQQQAEVIPVLEDRDVTFGEPRVTLKSPFEVAVDPLATDEGLTSAEYIVEETIVSPAYIYRHFPDAPEGVVEDGSPAAGTLEARFPGVNDYLANSRERRGAAGRRGVRVREYWSLPYSDGRDAVNGKHCIWTCSGVLLLEEDNPYPFLPYTAFSGLPAGRFYADAPIKDLLSPQVQLNKTESQIAENGERFGNPSRLVSQETKALGTDWQGLPGEEIVYVDNGSANARPSFLEAPQMPVYVLQQVETSERSIAVISGQNDVAQGNVPEGVTAASAISQLMEANETMIGPDIADMAMSLLDVGKKLLWCVRRYAKNDRLARIAGEDSSWDVVEFSGEALGEADGDAVVLASTVASSTAAKQAGIQWVLNTLIQNGQAPPPRELRRILRDYEVGGLEHVFASIDRTQTQVVEEHRRMYAGEQLTINSYDDDSLHLEEHMDEQRSSRYSDRVRANPLVGAIFEAHCQLHRQRLQQAANNAAAAQATVAAAAAGNPPAMDPNALNGGPPPTGALPSVASQPSANGAGA